MRLFIFAAILLFHSVAYAQKTGTAPKPKTTTVTKPMDKKNNQLVSKDSITAELIFSKVGKTKVVLSGIDFYSEPQLDRKKEIMYFLFERFNSKQVRRIVVLSTHKDWNWDTLKSYYSKLNAYMVKAVSYYWDTNRYDNVALLYLPYAENTGTEIPALYQPQTAEGFFVLVPYKHIANENKPELKKWEEKPFAALPNFTADCADMIYNYQPPVPVTEQKPVENKPTVTSTTSSTVSKGLSKEQYISMIYEAISLMKNVKNKLDYFNSNLYYKNERIVDTRTALINLGLCNEVMAKFSEFAQKTYGKEYNKEGLSPALAVKFSNYDRKIKEINDLMITWNNRILKQGDLILEYVKSHNGKEPSSLQYLDDGQTEYKLTKKMQEFTEYFQNLYSQ